MSAGVANVRVATTLESAGLITSHGSPLPAKDEPLIHEPSNLEFSVCIVTPLFSRPDLKSSRGRSLPKTVEDQRDVVEDQRDINEFLGFARTDRRLARLCEPTY